MAKHKNFQFTLQIRESTDIRNYEQLIALVRFIDGVIINQFLYCTTLPSSAKAQDVFNIVTTDLKQHGLSWDSCVGIYIDGASSMVGSMKGLVSVVEKCNPAIVRPHCFYTGKC